MANLKRIDGAAVQSFDGLLANQESEHFVLLQPVDKQSLGLLLAEFRNEYMGALRDILLAPRANGKAEGLTGTTGFDGAGSQTLRPSYFSIKSINEGLKDTGLSDVYPMKVGEHSVFRVTRMDYEDQKTLLNWLTGRSLADWEGAVVPHQVEHRLWVDVSLEEDLDTAPDGFAFLDKLAGDIGDALIRQTRSAKQKNRPIARYFFGKWLHQRGVWLFPLGIWTSVVVIVPESLRPLYRKVVQNANMVKFRSLYDEWTSAHSKGATTVDLYRKVLLFVDHTTTFAAENFPTEPGFFEYFRQWERSYFERNQAAVATGIRFLWRFTHHFHGIELPDDHSSLRLAGKSKLLNREAWAWVDDPRVKTKGGLYETAVGKPEPEAHPDYLVSWAVRMRELLPHLEVKSPSNQIAHLTQWLLYLCCLDAPPASFSQIVRAHHINSAGNPDFFTFMDFLKARDLSIDVRNSALTTLRHMWVLDATQRNADGRGCPIDVKIDKFKRGAAGGGRIGRTHRDAIEPEILQVIIEENRRGDFAFSRSRRSARNNLIDYRTVMDPATNKPVKEWWPGLAVLIDLLLFIPLRKMSARYLDSGEGDESTLDITTLEYRPNILPTSTKGRRECFFIRAPVSLKRGDYQLGMYVNTNKTGKPYDVPWIEETVAHNVSRLIAWQQRFNPIAKPVLCKDMEADRQYAALHLIQDSYPIFRDPDDPINEPVTESRVYDYFYALLRHCEPILTEKLGFEVSLFDGDTPRFDIHSLRVTGVTILLENGVDPKIVKELVGHASLEMTWHYHAISNYNIRKQISDAFEKYRPGLREFSNLSESDLTRLKANTVNTRPDQDPDFSFNLLTEKVRANDPQWEILPHGICPGGACSSGGREHKNVHQALHRERACSLCRFRVTGPMFLHGLVLHANTLMWEIKQSQRRIADLRERADVAEDEGKDPSLFLGQVTHEREACDRLFEEWFAEIVYIRRCEDLLASWAVSGADNSLPTAVETVDKGAVTVEMNESHELRLLHDLLQDSQTVAGVTLPRGVEEDRNEILLQIAKSNDLDQLFYRMDRETARQAFSLFAETLLQHVASEDEIDGLASGRLRINHLPSLEAHVSQALSHLTSKAKGNNAIQGETCLT